MTTLSVRRLVLTDFRCYSRLRIDTDARPVVLTGPNGAGKTNILEALSFLAPGRGLRRASLAEAGRRRDDEGNADWAVSATLAGTGAGTDGPVEIGTGRQAGSERRVVRIDGKNARPGDLGRIVSALWLVPAMDRLFVEGAAGRRRFLDRLVLGLEPAHGSHAAAFEHAMRERTRLLKRGGGDPAWLGALEEGMARHGVAMAAARVRTVGRLDGACRKGCGPFPAARLELEGEVEGWLGEGLSPGDAEGKLREVLRAQRGRDGAAGAALQGPHRTDLAVRHAGKDIPAGLCSTGEQKAVLVSIVLAQARLNTEDRGVAPLMLLDEVAAHLDEERRSALFDELVGLAAQSWITGTDRSLLAGFGARAQYFRVTEASVAPL